jgi:hypothetical protein
MKTNILFILFFIISFQLSAQEQVDVYTGASYLNEVYYNMNTKESYYASRPAWEFAFSAEDTSLSVLANNGLFIEVYTYPKGDTADWLTVDTTGLYVWAKQYNSLETWDFGAFNRNKVVGNDLDCGWGKYDAASGKYIGDSIFIVRLNDDSYRKMKILERDCEENTWKFCVDYLDNSVYKEYYFDADDFGDMNFVHFSLINEEAYAHEPEKENWQLYFNVAFDYTIHYILNSVWINKGVEVEQVDSVDQETFIDYTKGNFTTKVSEIGGDWKYYDMTSFCYKLNGNRVYFVKFLNEEKHQTEIWKMYFTSFLGMTVGNYSFIQEKIFETGLKQPEEILWVSAFPNPASHTLSIVNYLPKQGKVSVKNTLGKIVFEKEVCGFNKQVIDVTAWNSGIYFIAIDNGEKAHCEKIIIQ